MAIAAAPVNAAPARNLRRVVGLDVRLRLVIIGFALLGFLRFPCGLLGAAWDKLAGKVFASGRPFFYGVTSSHTRLELPHPVVHHSRMPLPAIALARTGPCAL